MLEKRGEALYNDLSAQEVPKGRDYKLLASGLRILEECRGWGKVEWRQFALMHDASIIGDTKYEGGEIGSSLEAWITIFSLWKKGKGFFLQPTITLKQIDQVLDSLKTTRYFQGLRPWVGPLLHNLPDLPRLITGGEISVGQLEDTAKAFLRSMKKELAEKGRIYLPLGYRHGVDSDGHVLVCKIMQEKGFVTVHLLNQGDGVSAHPPVSFTTTQERISYSYFPIRIENKVFFGEVGEALFCHLLRYVTDAPNPQLDSYHARDLYDLFKVVGEVIPDLGPNPEELAVNPQSKGNCSEKGVKNIVRDLLLEAGLSREELQIVFCNAHLCSQAMGYHTYVSNRTEVKRVLLRNAAKENGFLFQKLKERLSREEIGVATALLTAVLQETETIFLPTEAFPSQTEQQTEAVLAREKAPPSETLLRIKEELPELKKVVDVENLPTKFPCTSNSLVQTVTEWKMEKARQKELREQTAIESSPDKMYVPPSFSPATFLETIQEWNQKLLDLPKMMRFGFFYEAIFTLPIPNAKGESVWNSYSIEEARALLPHLQTLLLRGSDSISWGFLQHFLAYQTIYAIVDQLARQNPETKLEGYASPFPLSNFKQGILSLPDGRENIRYTQIRDYFSYRTRKATKGVIFPVDDQIPFEETYNDLKKGRRGNRQVANHIRYLQQFFFDPEGNQQSTISFESLVSLMCDLEQDCLPKEVYYLYYFASFIVERNGFAGIYLREMPRFLRFHQKLDEKKKVVLFPVQIEYIPRTSQGIKYSTQLSRPEEIECRSDLVHMVETEGFLTFLQGKKIRKYTTNDAVCVRPTSGDLPESVVRDLLRITRKDNLKVGQALDWLESHFFFLYSTKVQETLTHCFLAPGLLSDALEKEPTLIHPLRDVIRNGLVYLGESPDKEQEALFLISLGVSFELIYKQLYPEASVDSTLKEYREFLPKGRKVFWETRIIDGIKTEYPSVDYSQKILTLELRIQLAREDLDSEEIEHLLFQLIHHLKENLFGLWLQKYRDLLYSEEIVNKLCNQFLPTQVVCEIVKEIQRDGESWRGIFPEYRCGPYIFNLLTKEFRHEGKGQAQVWGWNDDERTVGGWCSRQYSYKTGTFALQHLIKKAGLDKQVKWETENEKLSADGTLKLLSTQDGIVGERRVFIQGEERWMEIHSNSHQIIRPVLLDALSQESHDLAFYVPKEKIEGDPDVWVYDMDYDIPLYRADSNGGSFTLTLVDSEGHATPKQKVNMAPIEKEAKNSLPLEPLAEHLKSFVSPNSIDCTVDLERGEIDTIYVPYRPQLSFRRGEYGFESKSFQGFYLTDLHTLPELGGFEGGLILENLQGERRLLLWGSDLFIEAHDFSREVVEKKESRNPLHAYKLDPITHTLLSESNEANLYLCYLYLMQKEYEKAFFYLQKVASINAISAEHFSRFPIIKDRSPSSLALNMKLIYRCIETHCHLSEKTITNAQDSSQFAQSGVGFSWRWVMSLFTDYLRATSREELSAIPKALRLSKGEEKTILSYMKRKVENLPQPLAIRYDLLTRLEGRLEVSISPKQVEVTPKVYERLYTRGLDGLPRSVGPSLLERETGGKELNVFSSYPIQVSSFAIRLRFPELYEKAKKVKRGEIDPFDLTLPPILKGNAFLGTVLFLVRHYPEEYRDLIFEDPTDEKMTEETWEGIRGVSKELIGKKEVREFLEKMKGQEVIFDYERPLSLQYPNPAAPSPFEETIRGKDLQLAPLMSCILGLFTIEELPIYPSQVEIGPPQKAGPLETSLFESLEEGRKEIPSSRTVYRFHPEHLKEVEQKLTGKLSTLRFRLQKNRKRLLARLNATHLKENGRISVGQLESEIRYKLDSQTGQTIPLLPETVMKESILRNDASFLRKHRPLLAQKEEQEVYAHVKEYYYDLMVEVMTKETLDMIKKCKEKPDHISLQRELAALLHYEFPVGFDPYEYPEIAYFKVTNGKLPRGRQLELYLWVCEGIEKGENRLFQMSAGGGKTSFLTPLIMLRAKMKGYLPAFCSTQSIYPIDKANLHTTLKTLEERLALLEVGMHMKLRVSDLQFIFDQLRIYREEGRELIVTPQIIYSLHLLYQYAAYQEKDEEKVKWLSLILAFWKKRVFLLPDESHRNLDALTRAIYGIGSVDFLPKKELKLFVDMMKPLLGIEEVLCEDGVSVAELGRLQKNTQGVAGLSEVREVRKALARYLMDSSHFNIPEDAREAFFSYWTDKKAPQPDLLRSWAEGEKREKADAAALVHYFLLSLLPQIVKMRTELDHAPSVYAEEEFDTPCHHKTPSTAQFEDVYRAVTLSIKGTFHRGLTEGQVRSLLNQMVRKDKEEQPKVPSTMPTPTMTKFRKWMEDPTISIRKISLGGGSGEWQRVYEKLRFHPKAIEVYLLDSILPKIAHPNELLTTTPTHILNSCAQSVSFSATPYFSECYPQKVDSFAYDRAFEAQVVLEYCKEENQDYLFPESTDPELFFPWLAEENPELFKKVEVLIDPGGFFCDHKNEHVARVWLKADEDLDGAIYFQQGDALSVDRNEKISLLLKRRGGIETHLLEGNQLLKVLEERGLDYSTLRIGTFYDAAHTESADIIQKEEAKALIFGGDTLTSSHLIQAIMRLRGFLDPDRNQTLAWVFQKDLAAKIGRKKAFCGQRIYAWTVKNEVAEMKKRVILAAFQEISYLVERIAWEEIEEALNDPKRQLELFEKYRNGFCLTSPHNPYKRYGEPEALFPTKEVLWAYAKQEYARFKYLLPFRVLKSTPLTLLSEAQRALFPAIQSVITRTEKIIPRIATNFHNQISQEVEQQTQVQREVEKEQYRPRPRDPRSAAQIYGTLGVEKPEYPNKEGRNPSREVFGEPHLTERLYYESNQLRTADEGSVSMGTKYLKPIDFFVIIHYDNRVYAEAVCNEIVSTYVKTLAKEIDDPDVQHTAFILTAEGHLYRKGREALAPSPEIVQEVLDSQWLQDLVIDAALLKGEVRYPDRLRERIANWPDFPKFWKRIVESLPNPEAANEIIIKQILKDLKLPPCS